jgi:ADP-ribose pyrophosphatase YjhB (NUDIX family)
MHKGPRLKTIPPGDDKERLVCPECDYVAYENPKIVAGAVVVKDDRILLCKRAIDPRMGFWTLPAGFLEQREAPDEGARREAQEEAGATIEIDGLLVVYTVRHISQVQFLYRARLVSEVKAGVESQEVRLFEWKDIPWTELAFPSVKWALEHYQATKHLQTLVPAAVAVE